MKILYRGLKGFIPLLVASFFSAASMADESKLTDLLLLMNESHDFTVEHVNDQKARLYWAVDDDRKVSTQTLQTLQRLREFLQAQKQPWYLYVAVFNKTSDTVSRQQALASSRYKASNIQPFLQEGQFAMHDIQVVGLGNAVDEQRILVNIGQGVAPLLMRIWVEKSK